MIVSVVGRIVLGVVALFIVVALLVGGASGCKAWSRYQKRADASNQIQVTKRQIQVAKQEVQVAAQQAEVKHEVAIGQREANKEIAKKLTPLFVQFEMIEALKAIAASGQNNSVVYIPAGANGVPLVSVTGQPQVYGGAVTPAGGK